MLATKRTTLTAVIAALALIAVGLFIGILMASSNNKPVSISGYGQLDESGTSLAFSESEGMTDGQSYSVGAASWLDGDGTWHSANDGRPDCLLGPNAKAPVDIGVLSYVESSGGSGGDVVVWLKCS